MLGCCSVTDAGALRAQAERRLGSTVNDYFSTKARSNT